MQAASRGVRPSLLYGEIERQESRSGCDLADFTDWVRFLVSAAIAIGLAALVSLIFGRNTSPL